MLVDLVSRGGNLLLDIGPAADGTIPVIMEQRLLEIGDWLQVNGEAIYGTRCFAGRVSVERGQAGRQRIRQGSLIVRVLEPGHHGVENGRKQGLLHQETRRPLRHPDAMALRPISPGRTRAP